MADFPSLPLFTDAYLADTRHLSQAEHGGYMLLLMTAWRTKDCSLPNDDRLLARWACCDARTWRRQKPAIMEFWTLGEDDRWRQKRLSKERNYVDTMSRNRAEAGRRGGLVSSGSKLLKNNDRDQATLDCCSSKTQAPTPTPTPQEKNLLSGGQKSQDDLLGEKTPPSKSKRGTRLDAAWKPCLIAIQFAEGQGMTRQEIEEEADQFRDYWIAQPGGKGVKLDWLATWRNWIRSGIKRGSIIVSGNGATVTPINKHADRFGGKAWCGRRFRSGSKILEIGKGWKFDKVNPRNGEIMLVPCDDWGKDDTFSRNTTVVSPEQEITDQPLAAASAED